MDSSAIAVHAAGCFLKAVLIIGIVVGLLIAGAVYVCIKLTGAV